MRKKSGRHPTLEGDLLSVVKLLARDKSLPQRHCDHALEGNWDDYRDCHIKPDLILIYRKPIQKALELVRLGSHSKLSL